MTTDRCNTDSPGKPQQVEQRSTRMCVVQGRPCHGRHHTVLRYVHVLTGTYNCIIVCAPVWFSGDGQTKRIDSKFKDSGNPGGQPKHMKRPRNGHETAAKDPSSSWHGFMPSSFKRKQSLACLKGNPSSQPKVLLQMEVSACVI